MGPYPIPTENVMYGAERQHVGEHVVQTVQPGNNRAYYSWVEKVETRTHSIVAKSSPVAHAMLLQSDIVVEPTIRRMDIIHFDYKINQKTCF
jgi:hypothetical protein